MSLSLDFFLRRFVLLISSEGRMIVDSALAMLPKTVVQGIGLKT